MDKLLVESELAECFGVATSLVANYGKEHNCLRRRDEAKTRIATKADQKLIELRVTAIALSKDDALVASPTDVSPPRRPRLKVSTGK
ncbi:hypothetical protein [Citreicoccus inhibens]|uniref:hypothetical protein n=1 Tax=Citreicoccus inhibens TaxID=2849499 RepID=UPI001F28B94A|nr:hypothetical protein [Citreicoccus inhibens]